VGCDQPTVSTRLAVGELSGVYKRTAYPHFKLSDTSYGLITLFMILHVIGSHYTYAEVPFGDTLQTWLGASRNMYDRLVHFSFGFLLAYPIHETFLKVARAKGFWSYFLPIDLTLSFSAIYEVIEWISVEAVDPEAGIAFLGSQGDVWDAQKDMGLAGLGALIAMLVVATVHAYGRQYFWQEMKESVRPIVE
jgi:putative membrane protein